MYFLFDLVAIKKFLFSIDEKINYFTPLSRVLQSRFISISALIL